MRKMSAAQIDKRLAQCRSNLAEKQSVKAAHIPGTAYHTRASREIKTIEEEIRDLEEYKRCLIPN